MEEVSNRNLLKHIRKSHLYTAVQNVSNISEPKTIIIQWDYINKTATVGRAPPPVARDPFY